MPKFIPPHRSLLFMPGDNSRAHEKAVGLAADALIFDLEDAVAEDAKEAARKQVQASFQTYEYGAKTLLLRINHPETGFADDDIALAAKLPNLFGIVIPKTERIEEIEWAFSRMQEYGINSNILCNIETPKGILNAPNFAGHPQLSALIAGVNDLSEALRLPYPRKNRHALTHALSQLILVARAHELDVYDGVYNDFSDAKGFAEECKEGRTLGFDGKTLIHPNQIEAANVAFSPSDEEIAYAKSLVEAATKGAANHKGAMVEDLHLRHAQRVLSMTKA